MNGTLEFISTLISLIQVISTYRTLDRSELSYHAGIMLRRQIFLKEFNIKFTGTQFSDVEEEAFLLLGALVYEVCSNPDCDLAIVR